MGINVLKETVITPTADSQVKLVQIGTAPIKTGTTAYDLLRRTDVTYASLQSIFSLPTVSVEVMEEIEIMVKYEGYIERQQEQVKKLNKLEQKLMPTDVKYESIDTVSVEGRQKLAQIRPRSLGQAARISGVSPADITALLIYLEQHQRERKEYVSK